MIQQVNAQVKDPPAYDVAVLPGPIRQHLERTAVP
jgi:hypothetical protein